MNAIPATRWANFLSLSGFTIGTVLSKRIACSLRLDLKDGLELREGDHAVFSQVMLLDDGLNFASRHLHAQLLHRKVYVVFRYLARAVSVELMENG